MHPFKVKKLADVNAAMNAIYLDLKKFKRETKHLRNYAVSCTNEHRLNGNRRIDTHFAYDRTQGLQIRLTASFGYYGQAAHVYFYLPIHSDVSKLFSIAYDNAQINGDAAYSRAEKAFTGC